MFSLEKHLKLLSWRAWFVLTAVAIRGPSDRVPFGQQQVSFQPRPPPVTITCASKLDTPEITQEMPKFTLPSCNEPSIVGVNSEGSGAVLSISGSSRFALTLHNTEPNIDCFQEVCAPRRMCQPVLTEDLVAQIGPNARPGRPGPGTAVEISSAMSRLGVVR